MAEVQAGKNGDLAIVGLRQGALAGSTLEWGGGGLSTSLLNAREAEQSGPRLKTCALESAPTYSSGFSIS